MKLIILDRDGVINYDSDEYIKSAKEWQPIEGSLEAIARLTQAGYRVVIASNQSAISRQLIDYEGLFNIHEKMLRMVYELGGRIDGIFFCPHGPADNCNCRKPKPGLLKKIAQRLQTDLHDVTMVGDSLTDIQAARAGGATPLLVRTGKGRKTERSLPKTLSHTPIFDDLAAAVTHILAE